jgi:hypothetical protein
VTHGLSELALLLRVTACWNYHYIASDFHKNDLKARSLTSCHRNKLHIQAAQFEAPLPTIDSLNSTLLYPLYRNMTQTTPDLDIESQSSALDNWVSPNPYDVSNSTQVNVNHHSNLEDFGFNHLKISVPVLPSNVPKYLDDLVFTSVKAERAYIQFVQNKLYAARSFILKEIALNLDSNRRMDKDLTAVSLTKAPIIFAFHTQELIRDLVKLRSQIQKLGEDKSANDDEIQVLARDYLRAWKELQSVLVGLLPEEVMERRRAETIMASVLGENLVEE